MLAMNEMIATFLPCAVLVIAASQAWAQSAEPSAAAPAARQPASAAQQAPESSEMVDVTDLIRKLRNRPAETDVDSRTSMRAIAPVIGAKPSSGVIFGVAGNVGFFRGEPATT